VQPAIIKINQREEKGGSQNSVLKLDSRSRVVDFSKKK
jgi:hypothetical protein